MEKSLAVRIRELLSNEWKINEIGWSRCPRYLYDFYKWKKLFWIFGYWRYVGVLEASSLILHAMKDSEYLEDKLKSLGIKVMQR